MLGSLSSVFVVPPLTAPSLVTSRVQGVLQVGRAMRVALPTGQGGVVHLFVVYGYQGSEEDAEKALAY